MADTPEIDLIALHAAIQAALVEKFGQTVPSIDHYARPGEKVTTPAIFFELDSIEPSDPADVGTEQFDCILRFAAYCITDFKKTSDQIKAKLAVRAMAANVLRFVRGQRWGQPVTQAVMLGAFHDTFALPVDQYEVQRVEWEHRGFLGESVWDDAGQPPTELHVVEPEVVQLDGTALPETLPDTDHIPGLPISDL